MNYIFKTKEIALRKLENTKSDCELILKWRTTPGIVQDLWGLSNEMRTTQYITQKNDKKLRGQDLNLVPCIIEFENKPIGYLQFYDVNFEEYKISKEKLTQFINTNGKIMAIDHYNGQGIGTKVMKLTIEILFEKYHANLVLIDPITTNERAISCYQKVGFKKLFIEPKREKQNGVYYDNLIMGVRREPIT